MLMWRYQCRGATDLITWYLRLPEQVFKYKEEIEVHSVTYLCSLPCNELRVCVCGVCVCVCVKEGDLPPVVPYFCHPQVGE